MRRRIVNLFLVEAVVMIAFVAVLVYMPASNFSSAAVTTMIVLAAALAALPIVLVTAVLPYLAARRAHDVQQHGTQATAEVLADARTIAAAFMQGVGNYEGPEILLDVPVRVQPHDATPAYEATMKASLLHAYLLKSGMNVVVRYDPCDKARVVLADDIQAIAQRNAILRKERGQ
jgi:hypothetical protein